MKKILAIVLTCILLLSLCSVSMAEEGKEVETSLLNAVWELDEANQAKVLKDTYYCAKPVSESEIITIYAPAVYFNERGKFSDETVNGYTAKTAPVIFMIGMNPENTKSQDEIAYALSLLEQGFVLAIPTVREEAAIVDYKAAIRWLKYNNGFIPGSTNKIVVFSTEDSGIESAILASSGNNSAFFTSLDEIGAVSTTSDDVYAANCYCAGINPDKAGALYAWMYPADETSARADEYMMYINSLDLNDENGEPLYLDGLREGPYYDYILKEIADSLTYYIKENFANNDGIDEAAATEYVAGLNQTEEWVSVDFSDGICVNVSSLDGYTSNILPEEEITGVNNDIFDPINLMIESTTAKFVRFRSGAADENAFPFVGTNIALAFITNTDAVVDHALAWNQGHGYAEVKAGDLIQWVHEICQE